MCWKRPNAPKHQLMQDSFEFSEYARIPFPFCPGVNSGVFSLLQIQVMYYKILQTARKEWWQ